MPDCHECGTGYPSARAADTCADQDRDDDRTARLVAAHKQPRHRTDDD